MIGPFPRRPLIGALTAAIGLGLVLTLSLGSVPTVTRDPGRYVTDATALGPAVGAHMEIPASQPLADGRVWGDLTAEERSGTLVILNFFATWCPPCQQEMPVLRAFDGLYRDRGLRIIGISVSETTADVARYAEEYSITYPLLIDAAGTLFRAAAVGGLPTQLLLDGSGRVLAVLPQPLTAADGVELIEPLLAGR